MNPEPQPGPPQRRLTAAERADLVAFLDGELDPTQSQFIASQLTSSPVVRHEIESLRRSWELLDHLPRPQAPGDFTGRTLALAIRPDRGQADGLTRWLRPALRPLAAAAVWSVLFVTAYALARWGWPNPTGRLERDLSLAEHLDDYQAVGSFEFLKHLDNLNQGELDQLLQEAQP